MYLFIFTHATRTVEPRSFKQNLGTPFQIPTSAAAVAVDGGVGRQAAVMQHHEIATLDVRFVRGDKELRAVVERENDSGHETWPDSTAAVRSEIPTRDC